MTTSHSTDIRRDRITAVVLAGGNSSRMGSDKALLPWRGRPFVAHIVAALRAQAADVVINTRRADAFAPFGCPLVSDPFPDSRGPLAGVLAGLSCSRTPLTLFVPCDNPLPPPDLAERLRAALARHSAAIAYAATAQDQHYLYALMRTDLREPLHTFLANGERAVRRWYAAHDACEVDFDDAAKHFININTAADLARLAEVHGAA